nr:transglutaminase-like domain-containing protein [Butyrivibrio sp.]
MKKRILALLLSTVMAAGSPMASYAAEPASTDISDTDESASKAASSESSTEDPKDNSGEGSGAEGSSSSSEASSQASAESSEEASKETSEETTTEASTDESTEDSSEDAADLASSGSSEDASDAASSEDSEELVTSSGITVHDFAIIRNHEDKTAFPKEINLSDLPDSSDYTEFYLSLEVSGTDTYGNTYKHEMYSCENKTLLADLLDIEENSVTSDMINFELVEKDGGSYTEPTDDAPVEFKMDTTDGKLLACLKRSSTSTDFCFYLKVTLNFSGVPDSLKTSYVPLINEPETFCDTAEEAYAAVRNILKERTEKTNFYANASNLKNYDDNGYVYDRIYVNTEALNGNSIDIFDVCDFDAEREGMLADEGDYLFNLIGNRVQRTFQYESPSIFDGRNAPNSPNQAILGMRNKGGKSYYVYEVYLPVITKKTEEAFVTQQVNALMGDTFAGVQSKDNKTKIQSIYDYITTNVSPTVSGDGGSDRTYPLYHTAYHALKKGNGTCEAFAQLFTRISREMGIPSKVIMGQDSSAHTYNIVDGGDGYWYYIDCSAKIGLSDSTKFKRAPEQERYTRPKFVINYLQKLKGGTNIDLKTIKILRNNEEVSEEISTEEVAKYIESHDGGDPTWTIRFDSNWKLELDSFLCFAPDLSERVTIDLNGHTLSCKNNVNFDVKTVKNGTIKVGYKDKVSYHSGNLILESGTGAKDVNFIGVGSYDYVYFNLCIGSEEYPPTDNFDLDNLSFKNLKVMVDAPHISYWNDNYFGYNLNILSSVTFEGCIFGLMDCTLEGNPIVTLSEGAKLIFNGTNTIGLDAYDNNNKHVYVPVNGIEFRPASGKFKKGDVLVTNNGTLKRFASKGSKANAKAATLNEITNIAKTSSHLEDGAEAALMALGKDLTFAVPVFSVYAGEEQIGSYIKWSEVVSSIETRNVKTDSYTVKVLEDANTAGKMTMPKKAAGLSVVSNDDTRKKLTFTGDITVTVPLTFKDLILVNNDKKEPKLNLGTGSLSFINATAVDGHDIFNFASVTGKAGSKLILDKNGGEGRCVISSTGAVTVGNLELTNAELFVHEAGLSVLGTTRLAGAYMDIHSNISFKDLVSCDENNSITYGYGSKNTFKVSGNVSAESLLETPGAMDVTVTDDEGNTHLINKNAISIYNDYCASDHGYPANKDLITGAKAPACMFAVSRNPGIDKVRYAFKKVKTGLRIATTAAPTEGNVYLYDTSKVTYTLGCFNTVQAALNDIKAYSNKRATYLIEIDAATDYGKEDADGSKKFDTVNLSVPAGSAGITIRPRGAETAYLHVKNSITVASPVTLDHLTLAEPKDAKGNTIKLNISLGSSSLTLNNVSFSEKRLGKITGSGTGKSSSLTVKSSGTLTVGQSYDPRERYYHEAVLSLDLTNVGKLSLCGQTLYIKGKTNLGKIDVTYDSGSELSCLSANAAVKTDKKTKKLLSVTTPISVAGTIAIAKGKEPLHINLISKADNKPLLTMGDELLLDAPAFRVNKPAFQLIKAPKANMDKVASAYSSGQVLTKKSGMFYMVNEEELRTYDTFELDLKSTNFNGEIGTYTTFANAIWEINNRKDKNAVYTIYVNNSEVPSEKHKVQSLTMPKAGCAKELIISGFQDADRDKLDRFYYKTGSTVKLTCNTKFRLLIFDSEATKQKGLNFNIGKNTLSFEFVHLPQSQYIKNITGNGVSKTSELRVLTDSEYPLYISGNLKNVGKVSIGYSSELGVWGNTTVGSLVMDFDSLFKGMATIKKDKSGSKVTEVNTKVSISKEAATVEFGDGGTFEILKTTGPAKIRLYYKNSGTICPVVTAAPDDSGFAPSDITALENGKFRMVKTSKVPASQVVYSGIDTDSYTSV